MRCTVGRASEVACTISARGTPLSPPTASVRSTANARRIACPPCRGPRPRAFNRPFVIRVVRCPQCGQKHHNLVDSGRGTRNIAARNNTCACRWDGARAKQECSGRYAAFRENAMKFFAIAGVAVSALLSCSVEHAGRRPAMAGAAGAPDRPLSGRRQCRQRGARHRRQAAGEAGPALHRGEQGRRRRPDRRRGVRENACPTATPCSSAPTARCCSRPRSPSATPITGSGISSRSPRSR